MEFHIELADLQVSFLTSQDHPFPSLKDAESLWKMWLNCLCGSDNIKQDEIWADFIFLLLFRKAQGVHRVLYFASKADRLSVLWRNILKWAGGKGRYLWSNCILLFLWSLSQWTTSKVPKNNWVSSVNYSAVLNSVGKGGFTQLLSLENSKYAGIIQANISLQTYLSTHEEKFSKRWAYQIVCNKAFLWFLTFSCLVR